MFKILFGKKLQELYDEIEDYKKENRRLNDKVGVLTGSKECNGGEFCKLCKHSYSYKIDCFSNSSDYYACKLRIYCPKFEER